MYATLKRRCRLYRTTIEMKDKVTTQNGKRIIGSSGKEISLLATKFEARVEARPQEIMRNPLQRRKFLPKFPIN